MTQEQSDDAIYALPQKSILTKKVVIEKGWVIRSKVTGNELKVRETKSGIDYIRLQGERFDLEFLPSKAPVLCDSLKNGLRVRVGCSYKYLDTHPKINGAFMKAFHAIVRESFPEGYTIKYEFVNPDSAMYSIKIIPTSGKRFKQEVALGHIDCYRWAKVFGIKEFGLALKLDKDLDVPTCMFDIFGMTKNEFSKYANDFKMKKYKSKKELKLFKQLNEVVLPESTGVSAVEQVDDLPALEEDNINTVLYDRYELRVGEIFNKKSNKFIQPGKNGKYRIYYDGRKYKNMTFDQLMAEFKSEPVEAKEPEQPEEEKKVEEPKDLKPMVLVPPDAVLYGKYKIKDGKVWHMKKHKFLSESAKNGKIRIYYSGRKFKSMTVTEVKQEMAKMYEQPDQAVDLGDEPAAADEGPEEPESKEMESAPAAVVIAKEPLEVNNAGVKDCTVVSMFSGVSKGGFAIGDLISGIQKYIRRGLCDKAIMVLDQLYSIINYPGNENQKKASRGIKTRVINRLGVIMFEDIGVGDLSVWQPVTGLLLRKSVSYSEINRAVTLLCRATGKVRTCSHSRAFFWDNAEERPQWDRELFLEYVREKDDKMFAQLFAGFKQKKRVKAVNLIKKTVRQQATLGDVCVQWAKKIPKGKRDESWLPLCAGLLTLKFEIGDPQPAILPAISQQPDLQTLDDFVFDQHTRKGKQLNRGNDYFALVSSVVIPQNNNRMDQEWFAVYCRIKGVTVEEVKRNHQVIDSNQPEEKVDIEEQDERVEQGLSPEKTLLQVLEIGTEAGLEDRMVITTRGDRTCGGKVQCFANLNNTLVYKEQKPAFNGGTDQLIADKLKATFGLIPIGTEKVNLTGVARRKKYIRGGGWFGNTKYVATKNVPYLRMVFHPHISHVTKLRNTKGLTEKNEKDLIHILLFRSILGVSDTNTNNIIVLNNGDFLSIDENDIASRKFWVYGHYELRLKREPALRQLFSTELHKFANQWPAKIAQMEQIVKQFSDFEPAKTNKVIAFIKNRIKRMVKLCTRYLAKKGVNLPKPQETMQTGLRGGAARSDSANLESLLDMMDVVEEVPNDLLDEFDKFVDEQLAAQAIPGFEKYCYVAGEVINIKTDKPLKKKKNGKYRLYYKGRSWKELSPREIELLIEGKDVDNLPKEAPIDKSLRNMPELKAKYSEKGHYPLQDLIAPENYIGPTPNCEHPREEWWAQEDGFKCLKCRNRLNIEPINVLGDTDLTMLKAMEPLMDVAVMKPVPEEESQSEPESEFSDDDDEDAKMETVETNDKEYVESEEPQTDPEEFESSSANDSDDDVLMEGGVITVSGDELGPMTYMGSPEPYHCPTSPVGIPGSPVWQCPTTPTAPVPPNLDLEPMSEDDSEEPDMIVDVPMATPKSDGEPFKLCEGGSMELQLYKEEIRMAQPENDAEHQQYLIQQNCKPCTKHKPIEIDVGTACELCGKVLKEHTFVDTHEDKKAKKKYFTNKYVRLNQIDRLVNQYQSRDNHKEQIVIPEKCVLMEVKQHLYQLDRQPTWDDVRKAYKPLLEQGIVEKYEWLGYLEHFGMRPYSPTPDEKALIKDIDIFTENKLPLAYLMIKVAELKGTRPWRVPFQRQRPMLKEYDGIWNEYNVSEYFNLPNIIPTVLYKVHKPGEGIDLAQPRRVEIQVEEPFDLDAFGEMEQVVPKEFAPMGVYLPEVDIAHAKQVDQILNQMVKKGIVEPDLMDLMILTRYLSQTDPWQSTKRYNYKSLEDGSFEIVPRKYKGKRKMKDMLDLPEKKRRKLSRTFTPPNPNAKPLAPMAAKALKKFKKKKQKKKFAPKYFESSGDEDGDVAMRLRGGMGSDSEEEKKDSDDEWPEDYEPDPAQVLVGGMVPRQPNQDYRYDASTDEVVSAREYERRRRRQLRNNLVFGVNFQQWGLILNIEGEQTEAAVRRRVREYIGRIRNGEAFTFVYGDNQQFAIVALDELARLWRMEDWMAVGIRERRHVGGDQARVIFQPDYWFQRFCRAALRDRIDMEETFGSDQVALEQITRGYAFTIKRCQGAGNYEQRRENVEQIARGRGPRRQRRRGAWFPYLNKMKYDLKHLGIYTHQSPDKENCLAVAISQQLPTHAEGSLLADLKRLVRHYCPKSVAMEVLPKLAQQLRLRFHLTYLDARNRTKVKVISGKLDEGTPMIRIGLALGHYFRNDLTESVTLFALKTQRDRPDDDRWNQRIRKHKGGHYQYSDTRYIDSFKVVKFLVTHKDEWCASIPFQPVESKEAAEELEEIEKIENEFLNAKPHEKILPTQALFDRSTQDRAFDWIKCTWSKINPNKFGDTRIREFKNFNKLDAHKKTLIKQLADRRVVEDVGDKLLVETACELYNMDTLLKIDNPKVIEQIAKAVQVMKKKDGEHESLQESTNKMRLALTKLRKGIAKKGKMVVSYYRVKCGRRQAKDGMGYQGMNRALRYLLGKDLYHDVDMINAHPNIAEKVIKSYGDTCPALAYYNANREQFIKDIQALNPANPPTRRRVKTVIIMMVNNGQFDVDMFFSEFRVNQRLRDLRSEITGFIAKYCGVHERLRYEYFAKQYPRTHPGKNNPMGAFFNMRLTEVEDQALEIATKCAKEMGIIKNNYYTNVFDGFMIAKHGYGDEDLQRCIEECNRRVKDQLEVNLVFKVKPMEKVISMEELGLKETKPECKEQEDLTQATAYNVVFMDCEAQVDYVNESGMEFHRAYSVHWSINNGDYHTAIGWDCIDRALDAIPNNSLVIFHNMDYDLRLFMNNPRFMIPEPGIGKLNRIMEQKVFITDPTGGHKVCIFKDSYALMSSPLRALPRQFGVDCGKKEAYPYEAYKLELFSSADSRMAIKDAVDCLTFQKHPDLKQIFLDNIKELNLITEDGEHFDHWSYCKFYGEQDVRILKECYEKFRQQVFELTSDRMFMMQVDIDKTISCSSLAMKVYRCAGAYDEVFELTGLVRAFCQQAVYGGRVGTWNNKMIRVEDGCYYDHTGEVIKRAPGCEQEVDLDAVNLYGSAMAFMPGLPRGQPKMMSDEQLSYESIKDLDWFVVRIYIKDYAQHLAHPILPIKVDGKSVYDDTLYPGSYMVVTKMDLEEMIKYHGISFCVLEGIYWDKAEMVLSKKKRYPVDNIFNEGIKKVTKYLFDKRVEFKRQKNPIQALYKLVINSAYGKMIIKPQETLLKIFNNGEDLESFVNGNHMNVTEIRAIPDSTKWAVKHKVKVLDHTSYPQGGSMVLSQSKRIMNPVLFAMHDIGILNTYQDTDSIRCPFNRYEELRERYRELTGKELDGKGMGQFHPDFDPPSSLEEKWTRGYEPRAKRSIYLGKKAYLNDVAVNDQGDSYYHARMKGISSAAMSGRCKNDDKDEFQLYQALFNGEKIKFELGKHDVCFKKGGNMMIQTVLNFDRDIQFKPYVRPEITRHPQPSGALSTPDSRATDVSDLADAAFWEELMVELAD